MTWPRAFHLPPSARPRAWRSLGQTALRVPVLEPAAVEALWKDLDTAAATWRLHPLDERLTVLANVLQDLHGRGAGPWREVLARSTGLSPQGLDAAWEVTFGPHTRGALEEALKAEDLDAARFEALEAARRLPRRLAHVVAGNVLAPTLSVLLRGWVLGAAQWLRPASREPLLAACLMDDLQSRAPELAACTAVLWWPHEAVELEASVLCAADTVTVQGSDESLTALEAKRTQWESCPAWVPYGSRWSAAFLTAAAQTTDAARALARDVALFDQQGCLSPTLVFAQRSAALHAWCGEVAEALAAEQKRMPRGELPAQARAALRHWHENARLGLVLGELAGLWEEGVLWAVALQARCALDASPLDRHVLVVPFDHWSEIPAAAGERLETLQGLALAADDWSEAERLALVRRLRPSRVAPLGRLQEAPLQWPQDHHAPFGSLFLPA